jgi:hypothetical protein
MDSIIDNGFAKPETAGYFHVVDRVEAVLEIINF